MSALPFYKKSPRPQLPGPLTLLCAHAHRRESVSRNTSMLLRHAIASDGSLTMHQIRRFLSYLVPLCCSPCLHGLVCLFHLSLCLLLTGCMPLPYFFTADLRPVLHCSLRLLSALFACLQSACVQWCATAPSVSCVANLCCQQPSPAAVHCTTKGAVC